MNIFNRVIPWFIPTKDDQRGWYKQELLDSPKEKDRLIREFSELSKIYNEKLGDFEASLAGDYKMYNLYLEVKSLAQKVNFISNRVEYKSQREDELNKYLMELNK